MPARRCLSVVTFTVCGMRLTSNSAPFTALTVRLTPWMVIEPVDPENNLTHDWIDQHIDELAGWLQRGRDDMQRAIDLDRKNNPQESLHHLVRIFGTPFKHHCGD